MTMLPYEELLGKLQSQATSQKPAEVGLRDIIGILGSALGQGSANGYGFGQSLGMAGGLVQDRAREVENYNRQLQRQSLNDQLNIAKTGFGMQLQQRQSDLEGARFGLAKKQFEQEQAAAAARNQAIGMLPQQAQQAILMGAPIGDVLKSTGVLPQPAKVTAESEKSRKLAEESLMNMQTVEKLVYDKDGSLNRSALANTVSGDGRTLDQALDRAIQNSIYLKTGAAAPDSEVKALRAQYKPSILDTKEQAQLKLASFKSFLLNNAPNSAPAAPATGGWSVEVVP